MKPALTSIKIHVHSFVDLITNSSTEIYIMASDKTIKTMRKLVNDILVAGKSNYTCDQLFSIEIDKEEFEAYYDQPYDEWAQGGESRNVQVVVKSLVKDEEAADEAAKVLSSLTSMFEISESYN